MSINRFMRQSYAQRVYRELTGWECPLNGGKTWQYMTKAERKIDREARDQVTLQLGLSQRNALKNLFRKKSS